MATPVVNPKGMSPSPDLVAKKKAAHIRHILVVAGCALAAVVIVAVLGFLLIAGAGQSVSIGGIAGFVIGFIILFFAIVGTIIFLAFSKAWRAKRKRVKDAQLKHGAGEAKKGEEKSHEKKKRDWTWLWWIPILLFIFWIGSWIHSQFVPHFPQGVAIPAGASFTDRVPAEYVREACTDPKHVQAINITDLVPAKYKDLPVGTLITITLHKGCFVTFVFPANKIYWAQKSRVKGSWAVAWCDGVPEPPTIVQPYYVDMEHSMDKCFARTRSFPFVLSGPNSSSSYANIQFQGVGTITFKVTANKTVFY